MNMDELKAWIKKHEGERLDLYIDTVGKATIGVGRNLSDNGISKDEMELMLENDIKKAIKDLSSYSWYLSQPEGVKAALVNMCFNLGMPRLLGFKNTIRLLINRDYEGAANQALLSKWAKQVGNRAKDVTDMIRRGK